MAIHIPQTLIAEIVEHARRDAPIEACGYLGGTSDAVEIVVPMRNVDNSTDHFMFDPAEQFATLRLLRSRGLALIAVYHSHPVSPARPSAEDIRLLNDPSMHYVIVSLVDSEPSVKSFRIRNATPEPEPISFN